MEPTSSTPENLSLDLDLDIACGIGSCYAKKRIHNVNDVVYEYNKVTPVTESTRSFKAHTSMGNLYTFTRQIYMIQQCSTVYLENFAGIKFGGLALNAMNMNYIWWIKIGKL